MLLSDEADAEFVVDVLHLDKHVRFGGVWTAMLEVRQHKVAARRRALGVGKCEVAGSLQVLRPVAPHDAVGIDRLAVGRWL